MNSKKDFPHRKPLLLTQSPLWFKTLWDRMLDILLGKDIIRADETELRDELRDPCLMSAHQPKGEMSLTSRNVSAEKHAESAFFGNPKSCKTGFGTTTAKRQLLRTHYLQTVSYSSVINSSPKVPGPQLTAMAEEAE